MSVLRAARQKFASLKRRIALVYGLLVPINNWGERQVT